MSDSQINKIIQYGTTAERTAFTPDPPDVGGSPAQTLYIWFDTDASPNTYIWDGGAWVQINGAGAGGISQLTGNVTAGPGVGSQVATIANDAVTYAKMQNVSAADRLLGRGNGSGAGDVQEIALGTNLSLSGTTLNVAGGGVTDAEYIVGAAHGGLSAERVGTAGNATAWDYGTAAQAKIQVKKVVGISVDGSGVQIATGVKGYIRVPWAGTITKWTLLADQVGDIVMDIWKDTFANYPPTVADTITAAAKPTISTNDAADSSTLTGWTTSISAGDVLGFNVDSCTDITRVTLELEVTF